MPHFITYAYRPRSSFIRPRFEHRFSWTKYKGINIDIIFISFIFFYFFLLNIYLICYYYYLRDFKLDNSLNALECHWKIHDKNCDLEKDYEANFLLLKSVNTFSAPSWRLKMIITGVYKVFKDKRFDETLKL